MRPARCIAPSECWNRLCSAAGNTQRADWSWGTRRNRCTREVWMRSGLGASPRSAPGRVYRMYWWMGSAMRPRPWYVSAAPFTASRLARPIERVPVDRGHRDDAHAVGALHRHLDQVARAPGPELEVEVLARLDGHAVDADDPVALEHARAGGGPEGRDLADEEPAVGFHRVEPEPGAWRPAHDPARADQLVLSGHELLDGDGEVRVRRLTEPERDDTDDLAPFVDHRAPAPARARRRDHEGAVEHVLPVRREALDRLELADDVHEVTVVVDADRARAHPGHGLLRSPERRHGPRAGVLELDHTQPRVEVEPDQSRAHRAAPIPLRLDRDRVQEQIAHGEDVAPCVEDDAAPGPPAPEPKRGGGPLGVPRSEEHTSELQSRLHLVCRLLLEKKKKKLTTNNKDIHTERFIHYTLEENKHNADV